jgi:hypothetical protein
MSVTSKNPLMMCLERTWDLLEADTTFDGLVVAGSRIKFTPSEKRGPIKHQVGDADLPEVRIDIKGGATGRPDSNHSSFTLQLLVRVATGQKVAVDNLAVIWAIWRALGNWENDMQTLTWEVDGSKFVKRANQLQMEMTMDNREANRSMIGWSTVWMGEVEMWFQTDLLVP